MARPLDSMVYVCVATGFNLPLFEACVARRPGDIVLVVSEERNIKDSARRLQDELETALPGVRVHRPDLTANAQALAGDGIMESLAWIQNVLRPCLKQPALAGKPRHLNLTGGTKAMSLALVSAARWDAFDYKAARSQSIEAVELQPDASGRPRLRPREVLALTDASPDVVARLYNDHSQPAARNPLLDAIGAVELAATIWDGQQSGAAGLTTLFEQLEIVWSHGRDRPEYRHKRVALTLPPQTDFAALDDWLNRFSRLQAGVLYRDGDQLHLPGNSPAHGERNIIAWLNANWLEQLCHRWLVDGGLPPSAVSLHLTIGPEAKNSASQREADVLIHYHGQTRLIEVKAGLPAQREASDLETQVSSLGERFGQSRKALFVSPRLRWQLVTTSRWHSFQARCKSARVEICTDRQSLLKFAGLLPQD